MNAAPRAEEAGAYPRDDRVAPVTRYRARQDIANSDYLGAALDDDDSDNNSGNNDNGDNGGGNGYAGGNGGGYGGGGGGGAPGNSAPVPFPTMSFSGTVNGSYGGLGKHHGLTDGSGCVYKGVMTDAEIATCKASSIAEMRHSGHK